MKVTDLKVGDCFMYESAAQKNYYLVVYLSSNITKPNITKPNITNYTPVLNIKDNTVNLFTHEFEIKKIDMEVVIK